MRVGTPSPHSCFPGHSSRENGLCPPRQPGYRGLHRWAGDRLLPAAHPCHSGPLSGGSRPSCRPEPRRSFPRTRAGAPSASRGNQLRDSFGCPLESSSRSVTLTWHLLYAVRRSLFRVGTRRFRSGALKTGHLSILRRAVAVPGPRAGRGASTISLLGNLSLAFSTRGHRCSSFPVFGSPGLPFLALCRIPRSPAGTWVWSLTHAAKSVLRRVRGRVPGLSHLPGAASSEDSRVLRQLAGIPPWRRGSARPAGQSRGRKPTGHARCVQGTGQLLQEPALVPALCSLGPGPKF